MRTWRMGSARAMPRRPPLRERLLTARRRAAQRARPGLRLERLVLAARFVESLAQRQPVLLADGIEARRALKGLDPFGNVAGIDEQPTIFEGHGGRNARVAHALGLLRDLAHERLQGRDRR